MLGHIVGVEFDQQVFDSEEKCEKWIRAHPGYALLLENRKWKLKQIARSSVMSSEGRRVFAWHGAIYQCHEVKILRPDPYVVVLERSGSGYWSSVDLPQLSEKAHKRAQIVREKQEERDRARALRRKASADKKKKAAKKKDPFSPPEEKAPSRKRKAVATTVKGRGRPKKTKKEDSDDENPITPTAKPEGTVISPVLTGNTVYDCEVYEDAAHAKLRKELDATPF